MIVNHRLTDAIYKQSPNVGGRLRKPKFTVIHYTAGRNAASSANWLCSKIAKASAHLVIGRSGEIFQLVPFDTVAWHAREANTKSIGIELDNPGFLVRHNGAWRSLYLGTTYADEDVVELEHKHGGGKKGWLLYTPAQLTLVEQICLELVEAYSTLTDVVGHDDVAPGRKPDPGPAFPMDALRSKVFGRG